MNRRSVVELYKSAPSHALSPPLSRSSSTASVVPTNGIASSSRISASSSGPYDASSTGRRALGWQPVRTGINTNLYSTRDLILARSRDEIRNNPTASSAIDTFEAQVIGNGIRPHWNIDDKRTKAKIEYEFDLWASRPVCDHAGRLNFYGLQSLAAREIFEGGEVFIKQNVRSSKSRLRIPYQLQLIAAEQCPIWRNSVGPGWGALDGMPSENVVRAGVEFDTEDQRVAYHMYRANPGETMFYPLEGLQYMRVPAENCIHAYRMLRTGQLRGQPHLTPVLTLLHVLDKYLDASLAKKEIQAMFAGFISKSSPDSDILPISNSGLAQDATSIPPYPPPGVGLSSLETGTLNELLPGESIAFPTLPQESDFASFTKLMLHRLASSIGITYEQLTGDLEGVNLSSIRVGAQDSRRKLAQLQRFLFVTEIAHPIACRWLREAVIAGRLSLPHFDTKPELYEDVSWRMSGYPYMDPKVEAEAAQIMVRCGFDSREGVVSTRGDDVDNIDMQNERDNERADSRGLVYDSDGRHTLKTGNPTVNDEDANDPGVPSDKSKLRPDPTTTPSSAPGAPAKPKPKTNGQGALQTDLM